MLYHSTRSEAHFVDSAEAVLEGLAPDGGLYMPESIPAFDWQACLRGSSTEMSAKILAALLPDIPDMDTLVRRAYQGKFETEDLTPTVSVGGYSVLELFRGPTSAFKDVALSMLPQLLTAAKAVKGMEKDILILTATSGDTGKAALEGFRDVPGVRICVFYPDGGVSQVQRAQMVTQEGSNVAVSAVRGNFDDAQTGVKNIFAACQGRELPYALSSANSINIGRLAPQIMYYFRSYRDLLDDQVNEETVSRAIRDMLKKSNDFAPSPKTIISYICSYCSVDEETLRGQSRGREVVAARQIAIYLIRRMSGMSLNDIGKEFGDRDHSTIMHSLDKVEKQMRTDPAFAEKVKAMQTGHFNDFLMPLYQGPAFNAGSTDVGDVSYQCPTAQIHVAVWPNHVPCHSWQVVSCNKTPMAHKATVHAGKVLCAAAIDLLEQPALLEAAKAEFRQRTAAGYTCPIPPDAVPAPLEL